MAEYAGFGYFAEVPGVIFDVQRAGPSTGLPTRTMQGDVAFAYNLSHGDTKQIVFLPATISEAYEFAMEAFELGGSLSNAGLRAERSRPGDELVAVAAVAVSRETVRSRKSATAEDLNRVPSWGRYRDVDKDGIPYRTLPGTKHSNAGFFTRGTGHDEEARYSELPEVWKRNLDRLVRKHETARTAVPAPVVTGKGQRDRDFGLRNDAPRGLEALDRLREADLKSTTCAYGRCRCRRKSRPSFSATIASTSSSKTATDSSTESCAPNCRRISCSVWNPFAITTACRSTRTPSSTRCSKPSELRRSSRSNGIRSQSISSASRAKSTKGCPRRCVPAAATTRSPII